MSFTILGFLSRVILKFGSISPLAAEHVLKHAFDSCVKHLHAVVMNVPDRHLQIA